MDVSDIGSIKVLKNVTVNPSNTPLFNEKNSVTEAPSNLEFPLIASFIAFDPTGDLAYLHPV